MYFLMHTEHTEEITHRDTENTEDTEDTEEEYHLCVKDELCKLLIQQL
jgi:hypothetical protein